MKAKFIAPALLISSLALFGNAATASDELAGAVIGAGAGALVGHSIDRYDGAAVGGILGAVLGVVIADDDDDRPRVVHHYYPRPVYGPPVVVYQKPHVRHLPPPVYVDYRRPHPQWQHRMNERDDWRDDRRNDRRDPGFGRDDRRDPGPDRGHDRGGQGRDDRGGRRG